MCARRWEGEGKRSAIGPAWTVTEEVGAFCRQLIPDTTIARRRMEIGLQRLQGRELDNTRTTHRLTSHLRRALTSGSHATSIFGTSVFRLLNRSRTCQSESPSANGPSPSPGASSSVSIVSMWCELESKDNEVVEGGGK